MKGKIDTYLNRGHLYYALEIHGNGERPNFTLLEVARKKGELFLVGQWEPHALGELPQLIKKDRPLVLTFDTAGTITKIVHGAPPSDGEALVHNSFPDLDLGQFHYQIVHMEKGALVSICKKEQVDRILQQLLDLKMLPVGFSLGLSNLAPLAGFLGSKTVSLTKTLVTFGDGSITAFRPLSEGERPTEMAYDVNGLEVPAGQLSNFGGILTFLFPQTGTLSNFAESDQALKREFRQKRHLALILKGSLLLVLGILFLNFLVFDHYFGEVNGLRAASESNAADRGQLTKIRERVRAKEERTKAVLSVSGSRATYYLDRLARSVPHNFLLEGIRYQPLQRPLRNAKPVDLQRNTITVSGSVPNNGDFSKWIEALEGLDWVAGVETQEYGYGGDNSSHFTLKIGIHGNR